MENPDWQEVTVKDLERHTIKHGQKATEQLMSILGKKRQHYDALMNGDGQAILAPMLNRMNELLDKASIDEATPEEKMEYKIHLRLLADFAKKIYDYQKYHNKIKGV